MRDGLMRKAAPRRSPKRKAGRVTDVLDSGAAGTVESSMTKVAVSESLFRVADRCVQVMGGTGVSGDTVVQQVFREIRAFRIYDGPTEVHKWSLAKKIRDEVLKALST
jgi:acyl-CoA dehydrogenase